MWVGASGSHSFHKGFTLFSNCLITHKAGSGVMNLQQHQLTTFDFTCWPKLARGHADDLWDWTRDGATHRILFCCLSIIVGCGCYGATIGAWHGVTMAAFLTIKLPLIVLFTVGLNGFFNAMLAMIFNTGLNYRETWLAILTSFSIFSLIVFALSPITLAITLGMYGPDEATLLAAKAHKTLMLIQIGLIAFAGYISTHKLWNLLRSRCEDPRTAMLVMASWLTCNLFMGAQIAFLLRPIFGTPHIAVQFLRPDQSVGNFYESLWWAITH